MLRDSIKERVDNVKPRKEGLTYTIDKLQGLDKENFEIISPLIDVVKIYGALPLLIPDTILAKKNQILSRLWNTSINRKYYYRIFFCRKAF